MQFTDFTILISRGDAGQYAARVESDSFGEWEPSPLSIPSTSVLDEIRDRFENRETDRDYLESIGRDLYERLISGDTRDAFHLNLGEVRRDPDLGLRIRLRIGTPELATLPWELLYSDHESAFIGTRIKTPLVRYLDMPTPIRELSVQYPLRILVLIPAGSSEASQLDAGSERSIIERSTGKFGNDVEVLYLNERFDDRKVTWRRVSECLAERAFHCVHFVGHGAFQDDRGYLILDGEDGEDDPVHDERFAELFANSQSLKLVVLNACNGATLSSSQPLAGSAAQLVQRGVPAVVAMQFSVYDNAAVAFCRSFYHSLFLSDNRGRVDVAVSRGRHTLAASFADQRELCAPVLFMRAKEGVLAVPERTGLLSNLPKNDAQLDTLDAARLATPSDSEAAKFSRRIKIAKRSVQAGLTIGLLVFFMSMVRVLDVFTIDTQAEFAIMALGNGLKDHVVSDDLRIVTIAGEGLSTRELRERVSTVISTLDAAGAGVIAMDIFYRAEQGRFRTEPDSGQLVVEAIEAASAPVVIGATDSRDGLLETPDSLRSVVAGVGHLCTESKLGLTRSLPISARASGSPQPSLALAAVAAFRGGNALPGLTDDVGDPVIAFADRPSIRFTVSELESARRRIETCPLIGDGDLVAHRFVRRTPDSFLADVTTGGSELEARLAADADATEFRNKLVVVGVTGRGDIVSDLTGARAGILWQADAVNNLLIDEAIVPVADLYQLLLMLVLAGGVVALTLYYSGRTRTQIAIVVAFAVAGVLFAVYLYGNHDVLLNPAYCLLVVWVAWWAARKFGKKWLLE